MSTRTRALRAASFRPLARIRALAFLALLTLVTGACATTAAGSPDRPRLRVLVTNDFHGRLLPERPAWADGAEVGGAAVLAAYFASNRAEFDGPTILLDGGDIMQGTPIVGGHAHQVVRTRENGIPIIQAGSYGARYGVVDLERVSDDSMAAWIRGTPVAWRDRVQPDSAVAELVERHFREVQPAVEQIIATLAELLRRGAGEYALGRLIADAQRAATDADVAIMNNGDGFEVLTRASGREDTGIVDLDALLAYLQNLPQPIEPPSDQRLRSAREPSTGS